MKKLNTSGMAVLAAALLLGALVGVVWARPRGSPQTADITRKVTLTGADFIPARDDDDWLNTGLYIICESYDCVFKAPVAFPCLPSVTIERITLHVEDNNDYESAEATLYRAKPPKGVVNWLGDVVSSSGLSDGLRTYTSAPINKVVWPSQRAYVDLRLSTDIYVSGVTIEYHRNL